MFATMPAPQRRAYQANDVYLVQQLARLMNGVYFNL
jgi:hypothetical protein